MNIDPRSLYESMIDAGAVLSGFCGTFLAFRIQREAAYHRQVAVDFASSQAVDVYVGLTRFGCAFLLLCLGSLATCGFGLVFPLLGLAGIPWFLARSAVAVSGVTGALVLLSAYFAAELVHYRIVGKSIAPDATDWRREWPILVGGILLAGLVAAATFNTLAADQQGAGVDPRAASRPGAGYHGRGPVRSLA